MSKGRTAAIALGAALLVITPAAAALRGQCTGAPRPAIPVASGALVILGPLGSALAP
jgi:hypothetical protein